jgi:hypothetical protein
MTAVTSIEFQVGGLTELAGMRPLKDVRMPRTLRTCLRGYGAPPTRVGLE